MGTPTYGPLGLDEGPSRMTSEGRHVALSTSTLLCSGMRMNGTGFFEKQKLTRPNFIDWYRQLRIVISIEDKLNYLEQPISPAPVASAGQQVAPEIIAAHTAWIKGSKKIAELMLMTMEPEIQRNLENLHAHEMLLELKTLFAQQAEQELLQTTAFGAPRDTWPWSKVHKVNKHKKPQLQMAARGQNHGNGKNKLAYAPKPKIHPPPKREDSAKDLICHECGETGHWKRNCPYAIPRDGIFEIDLSNSYTNDSSMDAVSNKRAKLDLDSALLWHCRLRHISKKRIEKLQHDGLLNSTDLRAFEKCVSCMFGKMARKSYTHQVKRAKDLLGLIHTDVCGPLKIMSRQGASYFVTFTDDFSRYGYVYLLKHKHEVFETFKVFQKEVEINSDHGIIAHRTPPYIPQHNEVSDRRNRTPLDMVRSMMSQTTLPKSFWNYALETAASIINMVPTKKFEKTPYEVWHGQAPKLSYLKVLGYEALVKRDNLTKPDKLEPRSTRTHRPTDHMCLYIDAEKHELGDLVEPANYKAALLDPESAELPSSGKTVGSKWLFKKKTNMDGAVHTYKALLVAKGYTQTPWIDYEETFSPVADIRAIRILIAIAAFYDYEIWQMDVKIVFLNGYLFKERYHMENSKRASIPMQEKLRLSKSQGASTPAELKRMQNVPYALVVGSIIGDIKRELRVSCYTDAGYLTDSAKQSIFATSSVEAEYIAAFDASKEAA
nr:hypothetical protein [Tanacetum cinerariifolium]